MGKALLLLGASLLEVMLVAWLLPADQQNPSWLILAWMVFSMLSVLSQLAPHMDSQFWDQIWTALLIKGGALLFTLVFRVTLGVSEWQWLFGVLLFVEMTLSGYEWYKNHSDS
jgi:ABC-type sulfate transport system permease subunit